MNNIRIQGHRIYLNAMKKTESLLQTYPQVSVNPVFQAIQKATKFDDATTALAIVGILLVVISFFILILSGERWISNTVAIIYPGYQSIKFLNGKGSLSGGGNNRKDHCIQLVTYWIIYHFLNLLEDVVGFILFRLPFYYILKSCFLGWCYHPQSEGSRKIYQEFIQKHFKTIKSHDELVKEKEKEIMSKKNSSTTPSAKRANTKTFKLDFHAKNISTTEEESEPRTLCTVYFQGKVYGKTSTKISKNPFWSSKNSEGLQLIVSEKDLSNDGMFKLNVVLFRNTPFGNDQPIISMEVKAPWEMKEVIEKEQETDGVTLGVTISNPSI